MEPVSKITAKQARYIKLGVNGTWEEDALQKGLLMVSFNPNNHELAKSGDENALRTFFRDTDGRSPSTSSDFTRQLIDFYHAGADTLWITFTQGYMWWCFAKPEVILDQKDKSIRYRHTVDGWHKTSVGGKLLNMVELNGNLTKTAMYRSTICRIYPDQFDYLIRKINDEERPVVVEAQRARASILGSIVALMQELQPGDFEILADIVFTQSGWRRLGAVGKTQKTIDMEIELPSTGERAFIQVKSHTSQRDLDHYIADFEERGEVRMFYVYHSSRYGVHTDNPNVTLIGPERLAEMVLGAGLYDWLLQKAG